VKTVEMTTARPRMLTRLTSTQAAGKIQHTVGTPYRRTRRVPEHRPWQLHALFQHDRMEQHRDRRLFTLGQHEWITEHRLGRWRALQQHDWCMECTVGHTALVNNTTGWSNIAVGDGLTANTTGVENTAVGAAALESNTNRQRQCGCWRLELSRIELALRTNSRAPTRAVGYYALGYTVWRGAPA
jgi:hypothetical protein